MKTLSVSLDGTWRLFIAPHHACKHFASDITSAQEAARHGLTEIPGTVPGNFELDMMDAGLLEDLFYGNNPLLAQELEDRHLWYCRSFSLADSPETKTLLHFEGIDTVAQIYLNGQLLGSTNNMLIGYDFDLTGRLLPENELAVHILPIFLENQKYINEAGCYVYQPYASDSLRIRKAPHMFGWDIMPRILSGGIWRSVTLLRQAEHRIEDSYLYTVRASEQEAEVWGYYRVTPCGDIKKYTLRVTALCGDSAFSWEGRLWHWEGTFKLTVENPRLWWPKNMGEPNLYRVTLELWREEELLDTCRKTLGIRTVTLDKTPLTDAAGRGEFCFRVNGQRMFVMGTNWVPLDAFHSRDRQRLAKAMELVEDIGVNMLRCWGGNVYEDHEFFDYCDRMGIAVWQDFAMGCAVYPQDQAFCDSIRQEAEYVAAKLRQHPSLFLWAGDNEVDEAYTQWTSLSLDPNTHNRITRAVLPQVLQRLDPARPYLPSSPFVDAQAFARQAFEQMPEKHLWGPRDYFKGDYYNTSLAHFASETGYHGCPSPRSMARFLSPDKLWPFENNDQWLTHAACMENTVGAPYSYRIPLMVSQVKTLFGQVPGDLAAFALASQLSQGEAVKFFIERFRSGKWRRTGIIWWNLLDGWPQFSDAVVDYYYIKKASYSFIKRSQAPVCLMFREPEQGSLSLVGCNELPAEKTLRFQVRDLAAGETVLQGDVSLPGFSREDLGAVPCRDGVHFYLICWELEGREHRNHYISGNPPYDYSQYIRWLQEGDLLQTEGF